MISKISVIAAASLALASASRASIVTYGIETGEVGETLESFGRDITADFINDFGATVNAQPVQLDILFNDQKQLISDGSFWRVLLIVNHSTVGTILAPQVNTVDLLDEQGQVIRSTGFIRNEAGPSQTLPNGGFVPLPNEAFAGVRFDVKLPNYPTPGPAISSVFVTFSTDGSFDVVPEPTSLALRGLGGLIVSTRRMACCDDNTLEDIQTL